MINRVLLLSSLAAALVVTGCSSSSSPGPASASGTRPSSSVPLVSGPPTAAAPSTVAPSSVASASTRVDVPGSATVDGHEAAYTGRLTHEVAYPSPGIVFGPAAAAAPTDAAWTKAFTACFTKTRGCVPTGRADVALASVSGPPGFPSASGRLFDGVSAFVVTWEPGPCFGVQAPLCRVVDIVPTDTLTVTYAFQIKATAAEVTGSRRS